MVYRSPVLLSVKSLFLLTTKIIKNTTIKPSWLTIILVSSVLLNAVLGDIYLHHPRGSNNRLNEENNNRRNGNRLFDSQNNNAGGYNVGDATNAKAANMDEQYKPELWNCGVFDIEKLCFLGNCVILISSWFVTISNHTIFCLFDNSVTSHIISSQVSPVNPIWQSSGPISMVVATRMPMILILLTVILSCNTNGKL